MPGTPGFIFKAITTQDCILEVPNSTSTDPYVQCYDTQTNKPVTITGSTMSHPTSPLTIPHTEIQPLPTEVMVLVAPTANKHMHHLQSTTRCGGTPLPNGKIQQNNGNNPSLHGITELLEKHKKGTISSLPSHKQSTLQSIPEAHCLQLTDHTVLQHWLSPTCAIHQLHTQQVSQTPHTRDSMKAISRHLHPTTTHNPPGTTIPTAQLITMNPHLHHSTIATHSKATATQIWLQQIVAAMLSQTPPTSDNYLQSNLFCPCIHLISPLTLIAVHHWTSISL